MSLLNRDWLHEQHRSPLAAWDPRKLLLSAFGWAARRLRIDAGEFYAYDPNADVKEAMGTSTSITMTLASLASSATAAREGTAVDNSSNLYLDAFWYLAFKLQTGSPANDKAIYQYVYGSEDGTNYTDNATGSDAAVTLRVPSNLPLVGTIQAPDSGALTYKGHPVAVASAFDGILPRKWGPVVRNYTGVTGSATEGDHTKTYSGLYATVI